MQYLHKIAICYIGIILITSIFYLYFKIEIPVQEGMSINDIGKTLGKMGAFFSDFPKLLSKPFEPITEFINRIKADLDEIPGRIKKFGSSFDKLGDALGAEFTNIGKSLQIGGDDIGGFLELIPTIFPYLGKFFGQYLGPRINCGIEKIGNLNYCFFYYFMNMLGETIYTIFARGPIFLIKLISGFDLNPTALMLWDGVYCLDDFLYGMFGYHFIRWSDEIMDKCFLCKNLKPIPIFNTQPFNAQIAKIKTDYKTTIPNLLNEPVSIFKAAGSEFKSVFT